MASVPTPFVSLEEYLEQEDRSETLREYYHGEVFPIEAATLRHQIVQSRLTNALFNQLAPTGCHVLTSGLRIATGPEGLYTYPDIVIVCGKIQVSPKNRNTVLNPKVLVEILSPSMSPHDFGLKSLLYRSIASLTEYILVHPKEPVISHLVRQTDDSWNLRDIRGMDAALQLVTLPAAVPFSAIYPAE